jgi:hypothetical protein
VTLSGITSWLLSWGQLLLDKLKNIFIEIIQIIIDSIADLILYVIGLFPVAPPDASMYAAPVSSVMSTAVQVVCWVLPVSYLLTLITFLVAGITSYFIIAPLARWAKLLS